MGTRLAAILLWVAALGCGAFISGAVSAVTYPGPTAVHLALVKLRSGASSYASGLAPAGSVSPEWIDLAGRTQITIWSARRLVGGLHVIELAPQKGTESLDVSLARLRADTAVEYAEPDQRRHLMTMPDDPLFVATPGATGQWYLQAPITSPASAATPAAVDAVDAWTITTGSAGLVIADIDNGVRFDHPDLLRAGDTNPGRLLPGYDFVSNVTAGNEANGPNADASDPGDWVTQADTQGSQFSSCTVSSSSCHGTRVSGVLGASTNNDLGIAGTTWSGWVLQARALGKCGGDDSDIETAMLWAAGEQPPKKVFGHGFVNFEGGKLSKSRADELKAKGLVADIRKVVNVKDSFTRMKQEKEREQAERRRDVAIAARQRDRAADAHLHRVMLEGVCGQAA